MSSYQYIYGLHSVKAALSNPKRKHKCLLYINEKTLQGLTLPDRLPKQQVDGRKMLSLFGDGAVHQGIALETTALEPSGIESLKNIEPESILLTLDQVTDPHNLGAITRSAAAFGVRAIILQDRHSPDPKSPILARTACGGLEHVDLIYVSNLARALDTLKEYGFWHVALDERGEKNLHEIDLRGPINLVMGAEGEGLRRLTREHCDFLVRLPTSEAFATLNVSNATAISLYEVRRFKMSRV